MDKFDKAIEQYKKTFSQKLNRTDVDEKLLISIAKSLGPAIYSNDSSKVACAKREERDYIKQSFLIKKLKLKDTEDLDLAIKETCKTMGSSNRIKYRAVFYYLLVERYGKEKLYVSVADKVENHDVQEENNVAPDSSIIPTLSNDEGNDDQNTVEGSQHLKPEEIIRDYAMYAAGAGLIPIPIIDMATISTVQYMMIKKIAEQFEHITFDKSKAKSAVAAIIGGTSSFELGLFTRLLFKRVPFFGPIIGGTAISGFAYASTKLIGEIFSEHFKTGGDLSIEELTMIKMKERFKMNIK